MRQRNQWYYNGEAPNRHSGMNEAPPREGEQMPNAPKVH